MLVFSRFKDGEIKIGDDITIVIVGFNGSGDKRSVRLGISAPKEIPVHRQEVWAAIQREKESL